MRIYVAGLYSRNERGEMANIVEGLANARRGIRTAVTLLNRGHIPFCPFLDILFFLVLGEGENISIPRIHAYSATWLRQCEAAIFLPGWEAGQGTVEEHRIAEGMGIPIYYRLEDVPIA